MRAEDVGNAEKTQLPKVFFDRKELNLILSTYGRGVAAGAFRDYAMDALTHRALFSIYRRASEVPLYVIEKKPELARRQGAYAVLTGQGFILKRGHDLAQTLKILDRPRFAIATD
jgi:hypothetical protein